MIDKTPEIIAALGGIAEFMNDFGVPGLIALVLLGPILMAGVFLAVDYIRQRHHRQEDEARRQDVKEDRELFREGMRRQREQVEALVEQHRIQNDALLETYRKEVAGILYNLGEKHAEVVQFYKDNVELVKTTQRMALDMRDLIVNNTRVVERLAATMDANFHCPIVREAATGKK